MTNFRRRYTNVFQHCRIAAARAGRARHGGEQEQHWSERTKNNGKNKEAALNALTFRRLDLLAVRAMLRDSRAKTAPHGGLIRDSIRLRVPRLSLLKTLGAQVAVARGVARKPHI